MDPVWGQIRRHTVRPPVDRRLYANGGLQSFPGWSATRTGTRRRVPTWALYLPGRGRWNAGPERYELDLPDDLEVTRIEVLIGDDSHHFIIYDWDSPSDAAAVPAGLRLDPYHAGIGLVAAVQYAQDLVLPEGTQPSTGNRTSSSTSTRITSITPGILPLQAEAYLNIYTQPKGTAKQQMFSTLLVNPNIPSRTTIPWSPHAEHHLSECGGLPLGHDGAYPPIWQVVQGVQAPARQPEGRDPVRWRLSEGGARLSQSLVRLPAFHAVFLTSSCRSRSTARMACTKPPGSMTDPPVNFGPTSDDEMMVLIMMYVTDTTGIDHGCDIPNGWRRGY